jgi:hypothetical protein
MPSPRHFFRSSADIISSILFFAIFFHFIFHYAAYILPHYDMTPLLITPPAFAAKKKKKKKKKKSASAPAMRAADFHCFADAIACRHIRHYYC